ncbi:MAG: hypothetical protein FWH08_02445 [Oscillospiraceae bacterium]|nr:hypothetical protein [Oscillospiraceae bacterium]
MSIDYTRLNRIIGQLKRHRKVNQRIGLARPTVPIRVVGVSPHAAKRAAQRGIPANKIIVTAQGYVNSAIVMFVQNNGLQRLYLSADGNVVVQVDNGYVVTIYTRNEFDASIRRIIEEVKKCRKK